MQETLLRRGPDQKGIWQADFVSLIHARLSIIDLDNGKQPMQRENCCMVYNGELYNSEELRQELVQDGWSFATQSDTEVVLVSYLQWKEKPSPHYECVFCPPPSVIWTIRCLPVRW